MKIITVAFVALMGGCVSTQENPAEKIRVIFDTDTNNELDDQHALAYLLFNGGAFDVAGITVNATRSGGSIDKQYEEAERVMRLCGFHASLPLYKGAGANFDSIAPHVTEKNFDGDDAVNLILNEAKKNQRNKLIVIAVGKLTNVALALKKDLSVTKNIKVVWLGSNYPDPGEYNLDNDTAALNFVLKTNVEFEMVTVRYGQPSGTAAVSVTQEEINERMPGKGPEIIIPVTGRHGGEFKTFGDYSVSLFEHIDYHGDPPSRALFDMAAVAIVKNPAWAEQRVIPAPRYVNGQWLDTPENTRKVVIWENFDKEKILDDFYTSIESYNLVQIQ